MILIKGKNRDRELRLIMKLFGEENRDIYINTPVTSQFDKESTGLRTRKVRSGRWRGWFKVITGPA